MFLENLKLMATSGRVGAKMSVTLGLSGGGASGCLAGDLWRGFEVFRFARKGSRRNWKKIERCGVAEILAGSRASVRCDNLHERRFWPVQQTQRRFRYVLAGVQDRSCSATLGGKRTVRFSGYISFSRPASNTVWSLCNHRSEESPRIISSSHQDGPLENTNPPPLFMGTQLKRFSHFRDGIVHWCRYLDVKKDETNYPRKGSFRGEQSSLPGTQIVVDDVDTNPASVTVICFDIETTGFSPANDRIIEFAARDLAGGVCSTIETLVNPQREVWNEHVHNISTRMVNNAGVPRWKDVALALVDFVESRRKGTGQVILVAHNGRRFDVPFVIHEFHACGVSIPSFWRFVDSLALAKVAMKSSGKIPAPKTALGQLFTYYNLPSVGKAHRAMADVNMLAQVLRMLMIDLEMSTEELVEQSFCADEIVLKGKDSNKEIVNSSKTFHKQGLVSKTVVENVNDAGSGSVPWDFITMDSAGRDNEDEIETELGVTFGQVRNPQKQTIPNKKVKVQRIGRAGSMPLMHNPPRVMRTPPIRLKKLDVQRDITT